MADEFEFLKPILDPRDTFDKEVIKSGNYYTWYYFLARMIRPRKIVEIGSYRGYSAYSFFKGAGKGVKILGIDNGSYGENIFEVERKLRDLGINFQGVEGDTQKIESLNITNVDLFLVDGDHSYGGAIHDLGLAERCTGESGVIIVDDIYSYKDVERAVEEFMKNGKYMRINLPTYRGLAVLWRNHEYL
jgi:predicted O-methyltransferase YrrM